MRSLETIEEDNTLGAKRASERNARAAKLARDRERGAKVGRLLKAEEAREREARNFRLFERRVANDEFRPRD